MPHVPRVDHHWYVINILFCYFLVVAVVSIKKHVLDLNTSVTLIEVCVNHKIGMKAMKKLVQENLGFTKR
jgi:hypothetical protein